MSRYSVKLQHKRNTVAEESGVVIMACYFVRYSLQEALTVMVKACVVAIHTWHSIKHNLENCYYGELLRNLLV
jgi:hypothetical protein